MSDLDPELLDAIYAEKTADALFLLVAMLVIGVALTLTLRTLIAAMQRTASSQVALLRGDLTAITEEIREDRKQVRETLAVLQARDVARAGTLAEHTRQLEDHDRRLRRQRRDLNRIDRTRLGVVPLRPGPGSGVG